MKKEQVKIVFILCTIVLLITFFTPNLSSITKQDFLKSIGLYESTGKPKVAAESNAKPITPKEVGQSFTYKDWELSIDNDFILFTTHGKVVHGHKFGWFTRPGQCDIYALYLTFSSQDEKKDQLDKLKGHDISLKVGFPEAKEREPFIINADIDYVFEFSSLMKIVTIQGFARGANFDELLSQFHKMTIAIEGRMEQYFDIPYDEFSLNGYIAAKTKAQETCEGLTRKRDLKVVLNK